MIAASQSCPDRSPTKPDGWRSPGRLGRLFQLATARYHGHRILGNAETRLQHMAYGRRVVSWLVYKQTKFAIFYF